MPPTTKQQNTNPPAVVQANPFKDLPALMKLIIDSERSPEINQRVEKEQGLTETQGDQMMSVIRKVIFKTITPKELVPTIQKDLKLNEERSKKLALDLLGRRFLAMEWYLGPVQPLIQELGGEASQFLAEARQNYPEVYTPKAASGEVEGDEPADEHMHLLSNFDEWVGTMKGKAEILLRLTNLSIRADEAIKAGRIPEAEGQRLLQDLDSVSYALNTKDLSAFEIHSLRRQVEKFLQAIEGRA